MLPPPSGHAVQNRAIVLERLWAINERRLLWGTNRLPLSHTSDIKENQGSASGSDPPMITGKVRNASSVEIRPITHHVRRSTVQETHQADSAALK